MCVDHYKKGEGSRLGYFLIKGPGGDGMQLLTQAIGRGLNIGL